MSDPVMETRIRNLEALVEELQEQVRSAKGVQDQLLANGLDDMLSGHGNQRFGSGKFRLDETGLQILRSSLPGEKLRGIYWLDGDFSTNPVDGNAVILAASETTVGEGATVTHVVNAVDGVQGEFTTTYTASSGAMQADVIASSALSAAGHRQAYVSTIVNPTTNSAKVQMLAPDGVEISVDGVTFYGVIHAGTTNYIDLTDGGATTLHSHAGEAMRVHVSRDPAAGAAAIATDWWIAPATSEWTVNLGTPSNTAAAYTSDLNSLADFANYPSIDLNSNGDGVSFDTASSILGTWGHARMAEGILGSLPTKLCMEWDAQFYTHTANETTSGLGFIVGNGSPLTAANHVAFIYSDGTNFQLRSSGATDAGAADDGNWHKFKIVLDNAALTAEWFIDGVTQGTIALLQDTYPVILGASAFTTNRLRLGYAHTWYE